MNSLLFSTLLMLTSLLGGCAYRFGLSNRALPGGYSQVAIPIFKNKSAEVGIEPLFTNALIRRFNRSQVAQVSDKDTSPLILEGTIMTVSRFATAEQTQSPNNLQALPLDAVLITEYRVVVETRILLRRRSDDRVIWQGSFQNEKIYDSPRIGTAIVNSANSTYNQSGIIQTISLLAEDMMLEAHDRITENY